MKDDNERNTKNEDLYTEIMYSEADISDLSFEAGFLTGFQLGQQMIATIKG